MSPVVVRLCQLDEAGRRRRSVVVSGTPTATWRFPRSNEAEASLHADARRLRETAAQEITRAGRANPPRPGVETARHGTSGTCVENMLFLICFLLPFVNALIDAIIFARRVSSRCFPRRARVNFTLHVRRPLKMSYRRGKYFPRIFHSRGISNVNDTFLT